MKTSFTDIGKRVLTIHKSMFTYNTLRYCHIITCDMII